MRPPAAPSPLATLATPDHLTTLEVARMLGMAVRSVQMMVDRGTLEAWKTPGGHRRITRQSVDRWMADRGVKSGLDRPAQPAAADLAPRILLIEGEPEQQALVKALLREQLPGADLHVADDGISGLALAGRLEPDLLLVNLVLPGIDGATLITSLRMHPQFQRSRLVVLTGLDKGDRGRYEFALSQVPVVHMARLHDDLPPVLTQLWPAGS